MDTLKSWGLSFIFLFFLPKGEGFAQSILPFRDYKLPFHIRADDIVNRLTLEEKVGQLMHHAPAIDRLGIPAYDWWNEALHGVARTKYHTTVFPQAIGMAATWNTALMRRAGAVVASEGRAVHRLTREEGREGQRYTGLTYWSPNINIFRDPRWGRGQETYGEDPFLTASIAGAYVRGIQGDDKRYLTAAACAKHFAVHSGPEPLRHAFNAQPSSYDLWNTYLPAFASLVMKDKVQGVMCAYNAVDGAPCCANDMLMRRILRKQWGFTGYVTSDCWGLNDFIAFHRSHPDKESAAADALIHTTDVECGQDIFLALKGAVEAGRIRESLVDTAVHRLFLTRLRLGLFDPPSMVPLAEVAPSVLGCEAHKAVALQMARESVVLLKNENQTLPLPKTLRKIVVCGPNADNAISILGNYTGTPNDAVTLLEGIRRMAGPDCQVIYEPLVGFTSDSLFYAEAEDPFTTPNGQKGIEVTYYNNDKLEGTPVASVTVPEVHNYWLEGQSPANGVDNFYYSARYRTTLQSERNRVVSLEVDGDDGYRLWLDDSLFVDAWHHVSGGPRQLEIALKAGDRLRIMLEHRQTEGPASIRMQIGRRQALDWNAWMQRHKEADAVVFVGGISPQLEGEELKVRHPGFYGGDRTTIALPAIQKQCLKALHDAVMKVVFVMMTGSAIAIPEEDTYLSAIVNGWYGGQEAGTALAEVLFGYYNPAGRLPVTFYRGDADLPPFADYSMTGRTYRYFGGKPLYPFGFGLSYSRFDYTYMEMPASISEGDSLRVSVSVRNAGLVDGDEVVQCYVSYPGLPQPVPSRALKGFQRIHLRSGEEKRVTISIPSDVLFDRDGDGTATWRPGRIGVSIGGGQPLSGEKTTLPFLKGEVVVR